MPFFEGAHNFAVNNATLIDVRGNLTQNTTNVAGNMHHNTTNVAGNVDHNNTSIVGNVNLNTTNAAGDLNQNATFNRFDVVYRSYHPVDHWTLSIRKTLLSKHRPNRIQSVDDIEDPDVGGWPFFKPTPSQAPAENALQDPTGLSLLASLDIPGSEARLPFDIPLTEYFWSVLSDLLPRQIYVHLLLRFPSLYGARIGHVLKRADLSFVEMKDMALRSLAADDKLVQYIMSLGHGVESFEILPPVYKQVKERWEAFIDNLLVEWRTLNTVSALLVPGILTLFQVAGAAQDDPVTRYLAFWSLLSALVSLLYGCIFIVQFSRARQVYNMVEWAIADQRDHEFWWNIPVMLAMPVVWLTWSIIAFIGCIVWFMWRARAHLPDTYVFSATDKTDLGFRIFISVVLGIGAMYSLLIFTTFQRYGAQMEEEWTKRASSLLRKRLPTSLQEIAKDSRPLSQKSQISAKLSQPPQTSNPPVFPAAPSSPGQYLTPQGWTAPAVQYFARAEATSSRQSPSPSLASYDNHI